MAAAARLWEASCEERYGTEVMEAAKAHVEKELPRVVKELEACAKYNSYTYADARTLRRAREEANALRGMPSDAQAAPASSDHCYIYHRPPGHGVSKMNFLAPGGAINDYYLHIHAFIDVLLSQSEMDGIRVLGKPLPDQRGGGEFIVTFDWRPLSVAKAASLSSPHP